MSVTYEWEVELHDENDPDGNYDLDHFDSFEEAAKLALESPSFKIVLVRNVGNEDDGLTDRTWAYVHDGRLDEWCRDSLDHQVYPTPKRYLREVAKAKVAT